MIAIAALLAARIGIDMENCKSDLDLIPMMDSFFTPAERERVHSTAAPVRVDEFLRIWTAKEAYVKAIGHGIGFGLREIETITLGDGELALASVRGSQDLAAGWKLESRTLEIAGDKVLLSVITGRRFV